jgi:hypothetical protein
MKVSKGLIQDKFKPLTVENEKLDKLDAQLD